MGPAEPIVLEGYDVLRELGRGAMGVVFLARDRVLEREVAIKVVLQEQHSEDAAVRFLREARAMARLSHPNVTSIFRAGVSEGPNPRPFVVMEWLRGRALDQALAADGPLSAEMLHRIALEVTRGLCSAHARGIIHRDIKPSNLFDTDEGVVKILDFGIAKLLDAPSPSPPAPLAEPRVVAALPASRDEDPATAATQSFEGTLDVPATTGDAEAPAATQVTGTALYMAPEVWRAQGADASSDLWSLGATLYHLATGRPPFDGPTLPAVAFRVMEDAPAEPLDVKRPDLPEDLSAAIERCLSKDRARRYASAQELLTDLERVGRVERASSPLLAESPYPGLRSMEVRDRDRFFGREDDCSRVIERLRSEAIVVLVGPSGAGKSSLAAAGVAPRVAEGALGGPSAWDVVKVVPGRSPCRALGVAVAHTIGVEVEGLIEAMSEQPDALARALRTHGARTGRGTLVLIDQMEELVTLSIEPEREMVAAALASVADAGVGSGAVRVLATARSDLFDRLGSLDALGARLGRATELVRPLEGQALRVALIEPARRAGLVFEDESIVDGIIAEAGTRALPLMAFAMRAWWERRDRARGVLSRAEWAALGGVAGAVAAHAEGVYESLSRDEQWAARAVFVRLVDSDGTRRYATRAELTAAALGRAAAVDRALEAFSRARLIVCEGSPDVGEWTILHESLAKAWPRLRGWMDVGRDDLLLHQRLGDAARAWEGAGRRHELLWRGALLGELERWRSVYDDTMSPLERDFAESSAIRARRVRRMTVAAASLVVVGLGGGLLFEALEARAARRETDRERRALTALEGRARGDVASSALAAMWASAERDPSEALAWLAVAARSSGEVTPLMRIAAVGLARRGVAMRIRCTAGIVRREDGATVGCGTADALSLIDLRDGSVRAIDPVIAPRVLRMAARADVLYWIDALSSLVRWDEFSGRRRIATDVGDGAQLQTDPSGARVVVFEPGPARLSTWAEREPVVPTSPLAARPAGMRVLREGGSWREVPRDRWRLHVPSADTVVLAEVLPASPGGSAGARLHRVSLRRGDALESPPVECMRYRVDGDLILCDQPYRRVGVSVLSGAERPLTDEEARALDPPSSEGEVLAASGERAIVRAQGSGVALRGEFPFAGPLGTGGAPVVEAAIGQDSARVALADAASVLHVFGAPQLSLSSGSWSEPSSSSTGAIEALTLSDGRVAIAQTGRGVVVVDPATGAVTWSVAEPTTVAVAASERRLLLGLADGRGVLVDPAERATGRGVLFEGASPTAVAVSHDGSRVGALAGRAVTWRAVGPRGWSAVGFRAFAELSSPVAIAVESDRLALSARWLGVVQQGAVTTLARGDLPFEPLRVARVLFSDEDHLFATDDRDGVWFTACAAQQCSVRWVGEGRVVDPIAIDAGLVVTSSGAVRLIVAGRAAPLEILPASVMAGRCGGRCALAAGTDGFAVLGPASSPHVVRVALPPQSVRDFTAWIAQRTNVVIDGTGIPRTGALARSLP